MFNNKILVSRGNIKTKKKLAVGQLFYDYPTKSVFVGTKDDNYKRIGGFDSLVVKGFLPDSVTDLTKLSEYVKQNIYRIPENDYTDETLNLLPGDSYILTKNFTDTKWKSGDIIIYTGDLTTDIKDAITATTANNILKDGWLYINCGITDASRVEYDTENTKTSKIQKLFEAETGLSFLSVQKALEYLIGGTLFYEGEIINEGEYPTINGTFKFYKGKTIQSLSLPNSETVKLESNSLILLQNGKYHVIPLGADNAKSVDSSFTKERSEDINLTSTDKKIESIDKDGQPIDLKKASDVKTVQQAVDWLHEAKADLDLNGKIPLTQIPNTLIGGLQFQGVINIPELITEKSKHEFTTQEFLEIIKEKFHSGNSEVMSGEYVVFSGDEASIEADEDFLGSKLKVNGVEYNSGDWLIYKEPSFMKMEGSAAVDNINGLKAAVTIVGDEHEIDDNRNKKETFTFTKIDVDQTKHSIKISTPDAVQTKQNLAPRSITIGTGAKAVYSSEVLIEGHTEAKNTTLIGKGKVNEEIRLEFPDKSGKILTTNLNYQGTKDQLVKFGDDSKLVDSKLYENGTEAGIKVNENSSLVYDLEKRVITEKIPANGTPGTVTYHRFSREQIDAKGEIPTLSNPATILSDCSVIDCGEWL